MSRDVLPGEDQSLTEFYYDKIVEAAVTGVDVDNGMLTLQFLDITGTISNVEINFTYFSYRAWFRFMPQVNDVLLVGFRSNGRVEVLGFKCVNYKQVTDEMDQSMFKKLQPGEFDLKSRGGAYIWASNTGELLISQGLNKMVLRQLDNQFVLESGQLGLKSGSSQVKLGAIRRIIGGVEKLFTTVTNPVREFLVEVYRDTVATSTKLFSFIAGDVYDSAGVPVVSAYAKPVRVQTKAFDGLGAEVSDISIDTAGNMIITLKNRVEIVAPTVTFKAGAVNIGSAGSSEKVVLGNQLVSMLNELIAAILKIQVIGNLGVPTAPPINSAEFTAIKTKYLDSKVILSDFVKTQKSAPTI